MSPLGDRRRPYLAHAARVALVATLLIGLVYVGVVVVFDIVVGHRLVVQVDGRLTDRLGDAARNPAASGATNNSDNAHDVDDAPVYLWRAGSARPPTALTPGAPTLPRAVWSPSGRPVTVDVGQSPFRLESERVHGQWLIVGQSLHEVTHVQSVLRQVELIAGPPLLVAVFFGTLLIGLKASDPVEEARRRQLEFTADASHELRTPLSVIEAEVSLALQSERSADEYRDTLERVGQESLRLRSIVEDLLWLSRFDAEPPPPGAEPVDVLAIANACADRFGAVAHRRDIELTVCHKGTGRPRINAAPEWIDRVVVVLVDNACRYAGQGGQVLIVVTGDADRVSLAVEDSGPGIAAKERSLLFDRFHRATDEGTGAGLGLAIADSVVRATGGRWRVGDASMGGARMEVSWHRSADPWGDRLIPLDEFPNGHEPSRRGSSVPG
jgi:two-component system, OmpR family, sensor histidine kinase CiaH